MAADDEPQIVIRAAPPAQPSTDRPGAVVVRLVVIHDPELPRLVVPATPRPVAGAALRQATVLDHKPDGTPYIRSYVEASGLTRPGDTLYEAARASTTVFCTRKLGFQIALVACHHYCVAPCVDHLEALAANGWRTTVGRPQYVRKPKDEEDE